MSQPSGKRGCFFWGCLTMGIVVVIGVVGAVFTVRSVYNRIKGLVADAPAEIRVFEPTEAQAEAIKQKWLGFAEAALSGEAKAFEFTEDDLNAAVAVDDAPLAELQGKAYFAMAGDELSAEVSMPLDEMGLEGKYLNGRVALAVRQGAGGVSLFITDVRIGKETLPGFIMKELSSEDLLADLDNVTVETDEGPKQVNMRAEIDKYIDRVEVADGSLHVTLKEHRPFISDTPADIEMYEPSAVERVAAVAKIEAMKRAAEAGSTEEFVLTEPELNTIMRIAMEEQGDSAPEGKTRITIEDELLHMDGSFPLDEIGFEGKFLNGRVTMVSRHIDGASRLYIDDIVVEEESLPEFILREVREEDITTRDDDDPATDEGDTTQLLEQAENIEIRDGELRLKFGK